MYIYKWWWLANVELFIVFINKAQCVEHRTGIFYFKCSKISNIEYFTLDSLRHLWQTLLLYIEHTYCIIMEFILRNILNIRTTSWRCYFWMVFVIMKCVLLGITNWRCTHAIEGVNCVTFISLRLITSSQNRGSPCNLCCLYSFLKTSFINVFMIDAR